MSNALYWTPGPSNVVHTKPRAHPLTPPPVEEVGWWKEYVEALILLLQRVLDDARPQRLVSPLSAPIPPPAATPFSE